jgi:hypothetical protein
LAGTVVSIKKVGIYFSAAVLILKDSERPGGIVEPFDFSKYRRPQFEGPLRRAAESNEDQMPTENLSELLGRVSENSTSQIDDLVGDFGRLREKLRTDGERIQREVEEYRTLSQQVMQLTKVISDSMEKVRASVNQSRKEE